MPANHIDSSDESEHGRETKMQRKDGTGGKKVLGPPVKAACLTCRNKKSKCDGAQPTCGNCIRKGTPCEYVKSRRGGARKKKTELDILAEPLSQFLKKLEDLGSYAAHQGTSSHPPSSLSAMTNNVNNVSPDKVVKVYKTAQSIIEGYYYEIYPWSPVLPLPGSVPITTIIAALGPRVPFFSSVSPSPSRGTSSTPTTENGPSSSSSSSQHASGSVAPKCSPLLLAILAILVLVPNSQDPNPASDSSRLLRRTASTRYASESMRLIDEYTDRAGNDGDDVLPLECVQALVLLSKWEMAQHNNFTKMRQRCGHAVQVAMDLGIHRSDAGIHFPSGEEWKRDVRRRTWWMVFSGLMQSSVISGTLPSLTPYDPRINAEFPVCAVDPDVWANHMNTLKQVVRAFELIVSMDHPKMEVQDPVRGSGAPPEEEGRTDKKRIHQEMVLMDRRVLAMLKDAEKKGISEVKKNMGAEAELARNFSLASRMMLSVTEILLHRSAAFPEVAIFSKRMCGLPAIGKPLQRTGHADTEILLDHFAVVAEAHAKAKAQSSASTIQPSALASAPPPLPPLHQPDTQQKLLTSSSQGYPGPSPSQQQPQQHQQHSAWNASTHGGSYASSSNGNAHAPAHGNGNGTGASSSYSGFAEVPRTSTSQLQQFDLSSGAEFPAANDGSYPAFVQQTYQTAPHLQAPFPPHYNQIPAPPLPQPQPTYASSYAPQANAYSTAQPTASNFYPNQTNLAPNPFDYDYDTTFDFSVPVAPTPKPWWEVEGGARAMILPVEHETAFVEAVLPEGTFGGGFPYNNDGWTQQMQKIGAPIPKQTSASYFNPISQELQQQSDFEQRVQQHRQQQQQQSIPPPSSLTHSAQNSYTTSPSSSTHSSLPAEIRAISPSLSTDQSDHSDGPSNLPWGLGPDLKPISRLLPPAKVPHGSKKETLALGGLGSNLAENAIDEALVIHSTDENSGPFPPGLSLARTSAAAHSIIRLEIIHRTAQFALLDSPRALPFCACGLVAAAHAFLLLAVAVQAGDRFTPSTASVSDVIGQKQEAARRQKEITALYTNVRIIVAGLKKYEIMWEGIGMMAVEVQEALDKAMSLTDDMARHRTQIMDVDADAEGEEEYEEYEQYEGEFDVAVVPPQSEQYYSQPAQDYWPPQQQIQQQQQQLGGQTYY